MKTYSVKEGELKKHLLMDDGYLSHILLTIIELPPHTTDNLQQLDLPVFKFLKDCWYETFSRRLRRKVPDQPKLNFVTHLCVLEVQGRHFHPHNIKQGFRNCRIFQVGQKQYPENRLKGNLKNCYDKWVAKVKLELSA